MKTLYLVRHAKSSWDDPDLSDFDRPLNTRGEKDAPKMGQRLNAQGVIPDGIYSSPAVRALTTGKIIAEIVGYPVNSIHTDRNLYHADEDVLLITVRSIPDSFDHVMIVGHNPGLTEFANELIPSTIDNIPTTGIVAIQLNSNSWKAVDKNCGHLLFFDYPKRDK